VGRLLAKKLQHCRGLAKPSRYGVGIFGRLARVLRGAWRTGLLCCATSAAVAAQPAALPGSQLVVSSTLERIVASAAEGAPAEVQIAADTVASHADQFVVSVRFTNAGESLLDTVRITSPIPADLKYVPDSASAPGSEVLFSVDNGRTFGRPDELTLQAPDGRARAADAADYTHVRWVLGSPLDGGATGIARFRAVPR
jgi:uncharacterized repeat protein (TIGR01451 family)